MQTVEPATEEKLPARQAVHTAEPVFAALVPAAHGVHAVENAAPDKVE